MDEEKRRAVKNEYLERSEQVNYLLDLPEAETDVMLALWKGDAPFNTSRIMKLIGDSKGWKLSTLISFLSRLEDKGFIMSYKDGKERYYIPLAEKDVYVKRITDKFFAKYHDNSLVSLLTSLYSDREFTDKDIDELIVWLETRRER
jgi:BlaI family transcriptional regulator, penicillinase repressor